MNQTTLFGNIGSEPVLNNAGDKTVIGFSFAVNKYFTDNNGQKIQKTSWYQVEVWNRPNLMNNIKIGDSLLLTGEAKAEAYVSKESGLAVPIHKLTVETLTFTSQKQKDNKSTEQLPNKQDASLVNGVEAVEYYK